MRRIAVVVLAACSGGETKPAGPPPPAQVGVVTVERRDVPLYIEAVGSVDGYVNADIRARVRGYLQSQSYKDGAAVKSGQMLFTIEPTEYQAAAKTARRRCRARRSRWRRTRSSSSAIRACSAPA